MNLGPDSQFAQAKPSALAYVRLLRPRQWVKNAFVLVGLLFGHAWGNASIVADVMLAVLAFSLASSATYVLNDFFDREADRRHPIKAFRPLACGSAKPKIALALAAVCATVALAISIFVSVSLLVILVAYLLLNAAYSAKLKHVPIVDVFSISLGFVLRLLAGTIGVGITPSTWLILCGMLVTLFLGFAKRRTESTMLNSTDDGRRQVLDQYDPALLDHLVSICAGATIVAYSLYTVSPHVIALHGTTNLFYSVPFAIYGMFRYLFHVFSNDSKGDPVEDLMGDPHIVLSVVGWCAIVMWALM